MGIFAEAMLPIRSDSGGWTVDWCLNSTKNKFGAYAALIAGCMPSLLFVLNGFVPFGDSLSFGDWLSIIVGIIFFSYFIFCFGVLSRKYLCDSDGITICYFQKIQVNYSWDSISSLYVCDINHAPKNSENFDIVIRFSIGNERKGPASEIGQKPSIHQHWRKWEYGLFNFNKIILIEYSPLRLERIAEFSKKDVIYSLTEQAVGNFSKISK